MNWAPCLAASCARSSCFWIIDSLSPVQLAWTSAPRTVRDIGSPLERVEVGERGRGYTAFRGVVAGCNTPDRASAFRCHRSEAGPAHAGVDASARPAVDASAATGS